MISVNIDTHLLMCISNKGPIHETCELLDLRLNPGLKNGILACLPVDGHRFNIRIAEIGLVEHKGGSGQTEEVMHGRAFLGSKQVIEIPVATCNILPLLHVALGRVAVVVDTRGPARVHLHTVKPIARNGSKVWPHFILLVHEFRA